MVRLAEAKGVAAPATAFVYAALLPQEAEARARAAEGLATTASQPCATSAVPGWRAALLVAAAGVACGAVAVSMRRR